MMFLWGYFTGLFVAFVAFMFVWFWPVREDKPPSRVTRWLTPNYGYRPADIPPMKHSNINDAFDAEAMQRARALVKAEIYGPGDEERLDRMMRKTFEDQQKEGT